MDKNFSFIENLSYLCYDFGRGLKINNTTASDKKAVHSTHLIAVIYLYNCTRPLPRWVAWLERLKWLSPLR